MGFSVFLHSGVLLGAEQFRATGSSLLGKELSFRKVSLRQPARVEKKFVGSVIRNEVSGGEMTEEKNKLLRVASTSIGLNAVLLMSVTKPALPVVRQKDAPSSWLSLPLLAVLGAIFLNAIVQYRVVERLTHLPQLKESTEKGDNTLKHRVVELEENVREFVTTARLLSRQVEKLGVRFRATKRTLRDPMQETAAISEKTSQVTIALAQREDRLEQELRELQHALLAMQEAQAKQLALISLTLNRSQTQWQALDSKKPKSVINGSKSVYKPSLGAHAQTLGGSGSTQAVEKSKVFERASNGPSQPNGAKPDSAFSSDESLSKIDFWKDEVKPSVAPPSCGKTSTASSTSKRAEGSENSNLGIFFSGRKRSVSTVTPTEKIEKTVNADTRDSENVIFHEDEESSEYMYVEQPDRKSVV